MKVLVLGANGMLGHEFIRVAAAAHEVVGTVRSSQAPNLPQARTILTGIQATSLASVQAVIEEFRPDAVVNCIGIVKQLEEAKSPLPSIQVNALFPHQLHQLCQASNARMVQISTDCVFSGKKGGYTEEDHADAADLYGRTKHLGEVAGPGALTLRTSIIGRQLSRHSSLLDWFLSQKNATLRGFTRAIFSGFTTSALSRIILEILADHPKLEGLYHVSAAPIDKHTLLEKIRKHYGREDLRLEPYSDFACDRSLDCSRFKKETGISIPSWDDMIAALPVETAAGGESS